MSDCVDNAPRIVHGRLLADAVRVIKVQQFATPRIIDVGRIAEKGDFFFSEPEIASIVWIRHLAIV